MGLRIRAIGIMSTYLSGWSISSERRLPDNFPTYSLAYLAGDVCSLSCSCQVKVSAEGGNFPWFLLRWVRGWVGQLQPSYSVMPARTSKSEM